MPCYDHRDSPDYIHEHEVRPLQERVDQLSQWLCLAMRWMPASVLQHCPPELQVWWQEHQAFDRERKD